MTGLVHIGPGAFHRAHQAVYTQEAGDGWQITGVSLRSTQFVDALTAQNGRYTLVTRSAQGTRYQTIEAMTAALAASRSPAAARALLAAPDTRIISLTVTEKAYRVVPDTEETNLLRLLRESLDVRRASGGEGVTLLSCDNLPNNGEVLRKGLLEEAPADLADWIIKHCAFPATMVDRITPAATQKLRDEVAEQTGWADQIPVETEEFSQWVIEDTFATPRPDWQAAGALIVSNVAPYEKMKLRMLNGAHSMLAYAGHMAGLAYVRDVMASETLARHVAAHITAASHTLGEMPGIDLTHYADALLERFRNPHIAHETYQIAMDGSQKLPQRIFAPALDAADKGQSLAPFARATALWLHYTRGLSDDGAPFALRDPREDVLVALPPAPGDRVKAMCALSDLVPPRLAALPAFTDGVTTYLDALGSCGVMASLEGSND